MNFRILLKERPFNAIKTGTKKVEGRVPTSEEDIFQKMKTNDLIEFENETTREILKVKISFVHHYQDIKSMLEAEGVKNVLSSEPKTVEHGIESYNALTGYKENVKIFGIYALGIRKIGRY